MELESDISWIEPVISAPAEGNFLEIKRELQKQFEEIYQNPEETPETVTFPCNCRKAHWVKGSKCTCVTDCNNCNKTLEYDWDTTGSVLFWIKVLW